MALRDEVHAAIRASFPNFHGDITDTTAAKDVPGWDSVSHVQLMFLIEEQTGKTIDIGQTFGLQTVEALVAYVDTCP